MIDPSNWSKAAAANSMACSLFLGFPARRCSAAPARWETDRVSPHLVGAHGPVSLQRLQSTDGWKLLPGTYPRARTLGGHVMLAHGRYFWRPDALSTMLCTAMMRVCSPPSLSPSHSSDSKQPQSPSRSPACSYSLQTWLEVPLVHTVDSATVTMLLARSRGTEPTGRTGPT